MIRPSCACLRTLQSTLASRGLLEGGGHGALGRNLTNAVHWWTEWAPAWGYIPATGVGEEDTLWRYPNIPRIIWTVSYSCHLIGQGMILHKWSFTFWPTVRGCPPLPSELTKYSPQAMSVFSSRIHQWALLHTLGLKQDYLTLKRSTRFWLISSKTSPTGHP